MSGILGTNSDRESGLLTAPAAAGGALLQVEHGIDHLELLKSLSKLKALAAAAAVATLMPDKAVVVEKVE